MNRIPTGLAVIALLLCSSACSATRGSARRCRPCPRPGTAAGLMMGPEQALDPADQKQGGVRADPVAPTPAPRRPARPSRRFTLAAAGLHVRTPSGWKFEQNKDTVVYQARARVPSIVFFRAEGDTQLEAIQRLSGQMSAEMRSVRVNRGRTPTSIAGYPALMLEGTGRVEIFPVRWRAYIIEAPQRVVMVAAAPVFFWGAQQARIRSFVASVHRSHAAIR